MRSKRNRASFYLLLAILDTLLILLLLIPSTINADYPDMDMSATPNPVGSGARALGFGGSFISVADDATAASWNPAALIQLKRRELSFVGSIYSGRIHYKTSDVSGDFDDQSDEITNVNYASVVYPFTINKGDKWNINIVASLNYQHLYEFSLDYTSSRRESSVQGYTEIIHLDHKYQEGSLSTISPAFAIQVHPSLSFGFTFNFWDISDNGWENITIQDTESKGLINNKLTHSEIYEKYDFSGFNMNLGFLYRSKPIKILGKYRRFRVGGVIKTPFDADIRKDKRRVLYEKYKENDSLNWQLMPPLVTKYYTLEMPMSYGLGFSFDFSNKFSMAIDVYRTHWDDYALESSSGERLSPITRRPMVDSDIERTLQARIGAEYILIKPGYKIPLRMGAFYDPEPADVHPNDYYGFTLGMGFVKERFSLDCAYQFRFGDKKDAEFMEGKYIAGTDNQHYLFSSIIVYW